jgi:hypothetical protein
MSDTPPALISGAVLLLLLLPVLVEVAAGVPAVAVVAVLLELLL